MHFQYACNWANADSGLPGHLLACHGGLRGDAMLANILSESVIETGGKGSVPEQGEVVIQLPGEGRGGRVWKVVKHDPKQLEPILAKKPELVPGPKEKDLGQTLHADFRFKALQSGDVELHYVLPSGDADKPAKPEKQFKVRVEVRPPQCARSRSPHQRAGQRPVRRCLARLSHPVPSLKSLVTRPWPSHAFCRQLSQFCAAALSTIVRPCSRSGR